MIDVFNHILPPEYLAAVDRMVGSAQPLMFQRARQIPAMSNVESRLRVMDQFPGYQQILSLGSPTVDAMAAGQVAIDLARWANDSMAALVRSYPDRFRAFIATVPMSQLDAAQIEAARAIRELGAVGIQIYTNESGRPIDRPEVLELFARVDELQRPIWLHPIRPIQAADYSSEELSRFDLWWAFGWPHETSVAMGRLVFAGVFDRFPNLFVITHHVGGTIPMFAGRIESGLAMLGTRNAPEQSWAVATELRERPLQAFKRFYADTASFGSRAAIECGRDFFGVSHLLFASDMPFDPEQGPGYIRDTIKAIQQMSLDAAERTAIFEGNIKRLLRWTS